MTAPSIRSHIADVLARGYEDASLCEGDADALLADPTIQITWKEGHGTPEDSPTETA